DLHAGSRREAAAGGRSRGGSKTAARHRALGADGGVAMKITVTRLTDAFAAEVAGVDIARPIDETTWAEIRAAFDEHSVLLFCGTSLDDDTQVAFSRRFGELEISRSMNPAAGT